jgi:FAD/FMN-containing dehydrogenase
MYHKSRKQLAKEEKIAAWPKPTASIFRKTGVSKQQAIDLELCVQGEVVWPWDPPYNQDRQQADPAFQESPSVIVYCANPDDIVCCLEFARQQGWKVTCRSGGHNTAGYSVITGAMTIDMSHFNYVNVDASNRTAVVGSGTSFDTLETALEPYGLHIPGGECPDVCIGGYAQGGGFGLTSRQYGINCDNILEARVMILTDSGPHLLVANASQNQELLWAICGGTGNNFGVLIDLKYRLHPVGEMWGFSLKWTDPDDMIQALLAVQNNYAKKAPLQLGFQGVVMLQQGDTSPSFTLFGIYNGPTAKGQALVAPLNQIGKPVYKEFPNQTYHQVNQMIQPQPNAPKYIKSMPPEVKQSCYIARPIDADGWIKIVAYYNTRPKWNITNVIYFEYYGGQISRIPGDSSAFIHREVYMDVGVDSFWYDKNPDNLEKRKLEAERWLDGYMALLDQYSNGEQYQNYPRRNTPTYRQAFWGQQFWKLLECKKIYDPLGLMDFPMGVTSPTETNDPVYQYLEVKDKKRRAARIKVICDPAYEKHLARRNRKK